MLVFILYFITMKAPTKGKKVSAGKQAKTSKKPSRSKRKPIRTNVLHPVHRITSHGKQLSWNSTRNLSVRTTGHGEITDKQQKAFFKCLRIKSLRRIFRFRGLPFVELTKKPAEVRMERSWYQSSQAFAPYCPGQFLAETNVTNKTRYLRIVRMALSWCVNYRIV